MLQYISIKLQILQSKNFIIKFHQLEVHKPKSIIINLKLVCFNSNNVRFNFYYYFVKPHKSSHSQHTALPPSYKLIFGIVVVKGGEGYGCLLHRMSNYNNELWKNHRTNQKFCAVYVSLINIQST